MAHLIFIVALAILLGTHYYWGFSRLSRERWQFIATMPTTKDAQGVWEGLNLTYYGLFNANACALAAAVMFILLTAVAVSPAIVATICLLLIALCAGAAKWVARWVEKKPHTLSIGGASFVGFLVLPWLLMALDGMLAYQGEGIRMPVMPGMAAVVIGYALGEGYGRLACISFGCCYGRPIAQLPAWLRPWLRFLSIVYHGKTKKIAYASGWEGQPVVAVQAITSVLYSLAALAGIYLYLQGRPAAAYLTVIMVTQLWRTASEYLRADYRGAGRFSTYQAMAVITTVYGVCLFLALPEESAGAISLHRGLGELWQPLPLVLLQLLWFAIFLYTGRSKVTGASISLFTHKDRV
jgi:hypothetical protein